jgi:hypothetical protein
MDRVNFLNREFWRLLEIVNGLTFEKKARTLGDNKKQHYNDNSFQSISILNKKKCYHSKFSTKMG